MLADVRFGSKADMCGAKRMSALPPIADMCAATRNVRFVPKADIRDVEAGIISSSNKDPITGLPTRSKARRIEAEEIFRGICERVRNAISYVRRQK